MTELMQRATALTRSGDLSGATALIQAALRGQPVEVASARTRGGDIDVIDVVARELVDPVPVPEAFEAPVRARGKAGEFLSGSHAAAGLHCDYRLFVPAGVVAGAPLVVMLHGCTQTPEDFAAGTRMNEVAAARGGCVLYPAQSTRMNPQRCWNWFKHQHQTAGRGEPALLESLVRSIVGEHALDASRVYVAGLSAGGAMAAILAQAYPGTFAAFGVHSGLPAGAARDLPSALSAMKSGPVGAGARSSVPCIVFHGDADATVHRRNGDVLAQAIPRVSTQETRTEASTRHRATTRTVFVDAQGVTTGEQWVVHGAPHAWAGGSPGGSYTDPKGPDASVEMLRFFFERH